MPRPSGPTRKATDRCAASDTKSGRKGFSLASVLDQNAFHRRWTMTWRSRRPRAMKRGPRHQQPRCAAATAAVAISSPPAHGRAFAHPLADCGLIADLLGKQEPRNQPQFSRVLSPKPPYPSIGLLSPYSGCISREQPTLIGGSPEAPIRLDAVDGGAVSPTRLARVRS